METPHAQGRHQTVHREHALGPSFRKPAKSPTRTHTHTRTIPIPCLAGSSNSSSGSSRRTYGARLSPPIPIPQNGEEHLRPHTTYLVPPLAPSPLPSHSTTATCPRTASASPRRNNHHHRARLHTARTPAAIRAAAAAVPTTTTGSPHQLHRLPPYLRSRLHLHSHSSAACLPTKSRHWFRGCCAFGSGPRSPKPSPESWGKRGKLTATAASSGLSSYALPP
ncbi:hypothetical protein K438DRAFT_1845155 [Mycena galopus ATCC 62051]|nr:hypothetical protein K438DRAFT_1845155 [Mycena galopus ATCC 62051]